MKRCKIEIIGSDSKQGFSLNIVNTAWFSLEGNWNCLPGFMPQTGGYFEHDAEIKQIRFWDRERTVGESISFALTDAPSPTKILMSLDEFIDEPEVGKSGTGRIYSLGSKGQAIFKDAFGFLSSKINWKVVEVI